MLLSNCSKFIIMITYTEKITLGPDEINQILESDSKPQHLEAILSGSKVLYTLMLDYEYGKGNLQNVTLSPGSLVFTSKNTGTLKVNYDINEFSVCAALDYTGAYSMILNFKIDQNTGEISLTGEERYE
jgi:hypothetical protein